MALVKLPTYLEGFFPEDMSVRMSVCQVCVRVSVLGDYIGPGLSSPGTLL